MSLFGLLLREAWEGPGMTQRELAVRLGISLGKCNMLIKQALEDGLADIHTRALTPAGEAYLDQYAVNGAIIMAASIDANFMPFMHDTPKALMRVEGERIIERQIRQLNERGITNITVVVGYMAERFDYLCDRFGVDIVFDPGYDRQASIGGLSAVLDRLGNSYVITADQWFWHNIFHRHEPRSWCACYWHEGETPDVCCATNGSDLIQRFSVGGRDTLALRGPFFVSAQTAQAIRPIIESEGEREGPLSSRWERLFAQEASFARIYANILPQGLVHEFDSYERLRAFDAVYAEASGNRNRRMIADIFDVHENDISDMHWLDRGMSSLNVLFTLRGDRFICRIPDADGELFTSHKQEAAVYKAVKPLGISEEVAHFDPVTGIKIVSHYKGSRSVSGCDDDYAGKCMGILRGLHESGARVKHVFNVERRLKQYEAVCRKENCLSFEDYDCLRAELDVPLSIINAWAGQRVLCHLNPVAGSFIVLDDGGMRLLDWENGAMCHAIADVAMFGLGGAQTSDQFRGLLKAYYARPATEAELELCLSYAATQALLWSLWAGYHKRHRADYSQYAVFMYRLCKYYTWQVRAMRGHNEKAPTGLERLRNIAAGLGKKGYEAATLTPIRPAGAWEPVYDRRPAKKAPVS